MQFGVIKIHTWWKWLPLYASPMFTDNKHPFRSAVGFAVGSFGRSVYATRKP